MTLGKKHPWALGKPSQKVWEEIWDDIGPRIQKVLDTGEATWDEALLLFLERSGYREETYHTFSYSPLSGDDGKIAGHLCVVTEETDRVIGERRLKTLRSLATELSQTITEEDVVSSLSRSLSENEQDLPFSLVYLLSPDGRQARLACRTGITAGHPAAPEVIELTEESQTWPMSDLLGGKDSVIVDDLAQRFASLPTGAWDSPPNRAVLLPMTSQAQSTPAGIIVFGLNPYRPLDVSYAGFLKLIAGQVAASISNARAYENEKKRAEALAEIDRAKTLFFSNVSHEFRTPLTLMLAPLEDLLAESGGLSPQQHERLDIAHRNSLRLLKLVNTLLDFSRIEAGRFKATNDPTHHSQHTP
jgi:K+-sensing histidine kinase KdpD